MQSLEWQFIVANLISFAINLIYALSALIIGALAFKLIDRSIFRNIDFIEEIKKDNRSAAIYASVILLFIAIILGFALKG